MSLKTILLTALLAIPTALVSAPASQPFWNQALTPPMGWNSWDSFGTTVTEALTKANTDYMATNLAQYGWQYITVDIQWYEPNGTGFVYPSNPQSNIDAYGRLWPVTNKHPSATNGLGFKPLADYIHGKGLKFGIHLLRGIPRRAWTQNTPVLGTAYFARNIADTNSTCPWNPDMYGVDMTKPGAQAYYNSVFALIAAWEVDFVKVDDLSKPYHLDEIEAIRLAIENSGRSMVLSTSPGDTPLAQGAHVSQHANLWRISDDFWDTWSTLYEQFKRLHDWTPYRGPGYWPDADMLPLGNIRTMQSDNWTRFTTNEQRTLMTMWSIARSPLIMGGHLPNNDAYTLSLLTNAEVIAVNQASSNNRQIFRQSDAIAWTADVPDSSAKYVALINANDLGFDESTAVFASGVISRSTPGRSTNIVANIAGATKLYLVVTDGGDYFGWDHADWGYARITKPDGSSNRVADLNWVNATSGWNPPPKKNASIEGNPLKIGGTTISDGIGTHAISVIDYNLAAGFTQFQALAGLDDEVLSSVGAAATNATVRFMVFTNAPTGGRTIEVAFASLGISEPVIVRDLWAQQDLGTFTNSFKRQIAEHASGLFKFTPVSSISKAGAPSGLRARVQTNQVKLSWNAVSGAEAYTVKRAELSGGPIKTVASGIIGTNYTDPGLLNGTWFYTVSARQTGQESAPSVEASACVEFAWDAQDIGAVQQPGNTVLGDGTFQVSAAGADIWGTSDAFRYVFGSVTRDATVTVRVRQQAGNDVWEKAGVMIRESTNADAKQCLMLISPSAISFQYRTQTGGGSASSPNLSNVSPPYWLKLVRRGNEFTAFHSSSGESWSQLGPPVSVTMNAEVKVGLAVCAHSTNTLGTAFFDQASIRNSAPPTAPTNLIAIALSETQAGLNWTDNAANETGFAVERRTAGSWEIISDELGQNTTNFMDSALTPLTLFSFRVRAVNAGTGSEYSPVASLSTPAGVGDGIAGWWRLQYFGDGLNGVGNAAPEADPDLDGVSNRDEYWAGTNPVDFASVFAIRDFAVGQDDLALEFSSVTGRNYRVQQTFNLQGAWTVLSNHIAGAEGGARVVLPRPLAFSHSYYRVALEQ